MIPLATAAAEFLQQERIAIAGVSHDKPNAANGIYRRMRKEGYSVYAVNPRADQVEGDPCSHTLRELPLLVDGVVIGTSPQDSLEVAKECVALGIPRVWFHHTFGKGSYSEEAVKLCEDAGLAVISGACPMMFMDPVDTGHHCFRIFFGMTGKLPRQCKYDVGGPAPVRE